MVTAPLVHLTSEVYNLQTRKWIQRKALLPNQLVFIPTIYKATKKYTFKEDKSVKTVYHF